MSAIARLRDWITLLPTETRARTVAEWMDSDIAPASSVSQQAATRIATVYACQRLIIDAVSTLPTAPYVRSGGERKPLRPFPVWMDAPRGVADPNYGWSQYLAEVTASLLSDGNAFVLAAPVADDTATELWVLDPRKVDVRRDANGRITYTVRSETGGSQDFDGWNVLHIARMRRPGELRGLSPIDEARSVLAYASASQTFGSSWYQRGGVPSGVLEYPGTMTQEQHDDFKSRWGDRHGGPEKVSVAVLSGGMTYKPVSMTMEQAQWVEGMRWSVEQIAALYGVPLHKLNVATPGAMSYASVEANETAWVVDMLAPFVEVIAKAHDRLLPYRPASYLDISLKGRLRGDTAARAAFYSGLFNIGALSPNDVRRLEDQPAIPGGDMYRVPLALGSGEATGTIALNEKAKLAGNLVTAGYSLTEAAAVAGLPVPSVEPVADEPDVPAEPPADATGSRDVVFNLNVDGASFAMPKQDPPVVNIPAPVVNVDVPAPVVNIEAARSVRTVVKDVQRDEHHRIVRVVETQTDDEEIA